MKRVQTHGGASDSADSRSSRSRRARGERGVALIEFAIIVPLLFFLIFGIIDFSWAFFQQLDVRHGARESARLVAVNFKTTATPSAADQLTEIITEACARMDSGDNVSVRFHRSSTAVVGQPVEVDVKKPVDTLTGFVDAFIPSDTSSHVKIRLEQDATWANMGNTDADFRSCPP